MPPSARTLKLTTRCGCAPPIRGGPMAPRCSSSAGYSSCFKNDRRQLEFVRQAQAAPVLALHGDRCVGLLGHDEFPRPHVTAVGLQQKRALVAAGSQAGAVIEDAPIATV